VIGSNLYWANGGVGGSVKTMPLGGGTPTTVFMGLGGSLIDMAFDETGFYWTLDDGNNHGTLMRVPVGGGDPITLVDMMHNPATPKLDATSIYWTVWDSLEGVGRIMKLAK